MSEEDKKIDIKANFEEMKAILDKKTENQLTSEQKARIDELDVIFDKQEEQNQAFMKKQGELKAKNAELEEKHISMEKVLKENYVPKEAYDAIMETIKGLEKEMARPDFGKQSDEESPEKKAFRLIVKKGHTKMVEENPNEVKYLRTDSGAEGGVLLLPPTMSDEILKKITEISPMRQVARIKTTTSKSYIQPVRQTLLVSQGKGEGQSSDSSNSTYGEVEIFPQDMTVDVPITLNIIQDAAFDMESEIMEDVNEEFGRQEGFQSALGKSSLNEMNGFLLNTDIQVIPSAALTSAQITGDDLIDITGELKTGYDPTFFFSRRTLAFIRKLKNGAGDYLWTPTRGLASGEPNTINGDPYIIFPDMPDLTSASKSVAYGDWRKGYCIVDRQGIDMLRDPFSLSRQRKVQFIFTRRVGGNVILPEAIKILTAAA